MAVTIAGTVSDAQLLIKLIRAELKLKEVRNYLKKAENPLFFYDDDPDGLCSYLLFKKFAEKGKGIPVKSAILDEKFLKKVKENSPDYIFVLDQPRIDQEFVDKINVPLIWLDHHPLADLKGIHYYNPLQYKPKNNKPTTYYAYKITKQNLWIATLGSIADWHVPNFIKDFNKKYPDLTNNKTKPGDLNFTTKIGDLIKIFSFLLKGRTSEVKKRVSALSRIKSPYEIINQETPNGRFLYKQADKFKKEYQSILNKAINQPQEKNIFVFKYPSSKNSYTSLLSNELNYLLPKKLVIIARQKDSDLRMSLRYNKPLHPILEKATKGIEATYGGHEFACGATIKEKDFKTFIQKITQAVK